MTELANLQSIERIRAVMAEKAAEAEARFAEEPEGETEGSTPAGQELTDKELINGLRENEDGDAQVYIALHRGRFCFDHAASQWHVWAGHHWETDKTEAALAGIRDVVDIYSREAMRHSFLEAKATKDGDDKAANKHHTLAGNFNTRIRKLREMKRKTPVLHLARAGADSLGISGDEWDTKPKLLAVENGVIDLTTGELYDGHPEDYLRAHAPFAWQGLNAPCPTWQNFLETTFDRDFELIEFMARLLGYCLTGQTTEAVLPILWGTGRNGKTVMLQALADVLGQDLSGPLEAEFLLEQKFAKPSGGPSSDKLYLRGRRLAWLSETNENRRLNSGKVKLLTGGDIITGRAPYGRQQISFAPTHKIFLLTNHRPKADARDQALWRRVLLIPFKMAFVPNPDPAKANEQLADKNLPEKLRAEGPGILAWLVRGCLAWQKEGLNPPESVLAATQEYQDSEDTIKTFISEKCIEGAGHTVRAAALYAAYKAWQEGNGEKAMTATKFGKCISETFDWVKDRGGKMYLGLELCSDSN
jgi:putative DNA primase/helicase